MSAATKKISKEHQNGDVICLMKIISTVRSGKPVITFHLKTAGTRLAVLYLICSVDNTDRWFQCQTPFLYNTDSGLLLH